MRGTDRRERRRPPRDIPQKPRDEEHGDDQDREQAGDEDEQRLQLAADVLERLARRRERAARHVVDPSADEWQPFKRVAELRAGRLDVLATATQDATSLGELRDRVVDAQTDERPERDPEPRRDVGEHLAEACRRDLAVELEHRLLPPGRVWVAPDVTSGRPRTACRGWGHAAP